jgi:hypothetical protein
MLDMVLQALKNPVIRALEANLRAENVIFDRVG